MGISAGGFKGDQDLDDRPAGPGRGLQLPSWGWIQTKVTMSGGEGGLWHTLPLVPSTHRDSSRTPPNPGEVGGGGAGTVPAGQLGKTGPGGKSEDECLINRGLSSSQK